MNINADFNQTAIIHAEEYQWVSSTQQGVERMMLDRIGDEKARASSIVRYEPNSNFPRHNHPCGEEILVLSGTFSDDTGDYPAGWYLRNPPGSAHSPHSKDGATIFVKLWQMSADEKAHVRINTKEKACWKTIDDSEVCPLFSNKHEIVELRKMNQGDQLSHKENTQTELLILSGALNVNNLSYPSGSWLRLANDHILDVIAGEQATVLYVKESVAR